MKKVQLGLGTMVWGSALAACMLAFPGCAATDNGILEGDSPSDPDAGTSSATDTGSNDAVRDASDVDADADADADARARDGGPSDANVEPPEPTDPVCKGAPLGTPCTIGGEICDGKDRCTVGFAVVRVGDGALSLGKSSAPVFIDHKTLTGVELAASVALPTSASGAQQPFTLEGKRDDEGGLSLSEDGHFLVLAGYAVVPYYSEVHESSSAYVPRVVARIGADGSVDTSTSLGAAFDKKSVRGATSKDGTSFWASGEGKSSTGGVYAKGFQTDTAAIRLTGLLESANHVHVFGGQLYASTDDEHLPSVFAVGTGTPTTAGQTITPLAGLPTGDDDETHGFALVDANPDAAGLDTLFVANAGVSAIVKWTFDGTSWKQAYAVDTGEEPRGLAARVVGTKIVVVASLEGDSGNAIVTLSDRGTGIPVLQTVSTAASGTAFRGVAWLPH